MTDDEPRKAPSAKPAQPSARPANVAAAFARHAVRWIWRIVDAMHRHHALDAASAMAFHFFLSLIPLLVVMGYVLGLLVRQKGVEAFMDPLLEAAPSMATDLVRRELERLAGATSSPIAPVGILGFLWIASSGTHGLMNVFELVFGSTKRPWWKKRAIATAWVLLSILIVSGAAWGVLAVGQELDTWDPASGGGLIAPTPTSGAGASASPAASTPRARTGKATPRPLGQKVKKRVARLVSTPAQRWTLIGVLLGLGLSGLAAFYRFSVEHPKDVRRRAWPGAFVAMTAFLVVSWGFGAYVSQLGSYALFYGGLAAVAVLMFWFYLSSLALLLGAEVNAQLEGVRQTPRT
jgi:membrane protein